MKDHTTSIKTRKKIPRILSLCAEIGLAAVLAFTGGCGILADDPDATRSARATTSAASAENPGSSGEASVFASSEPEFLSAAPSVPENRTETVSSGSGTGSSENAPRASSTLPPASSTPKIPTNTASSKAPAPADTFEVTRLPGTVLQGEYASVSIRGTSGVRYSITVYYSSGPSTADGLESKTADASGIVSWCWKVGTRTKPGNWSLTISGSDGSSQNIPFTVQ